MSSPASRFSKAEIRELEQLLASVLNMEAVGHPVSWHNKKTRNSAVITALTVEPTGCRKSAVSLIGRKGGTANGVYLFCKNESGEWRRKISDH